MGRGEFDEILEESLSALLEGRRSIEESLSLYPAWRGRLEPLLRAAQETAAGLNQLPPAYVKERGLQRFLEAARTRRRLREILPPQAAGTPWWRWASTGLAAVVVIGVLAFMSATLMAEGGQTLGGRVSVVRPYSAPDEPAVGAVPARTTLERVQDQLAALEDTVREGEPVEVGMLAALQEASNELAADLEGSSELALLDRAAAVSVANREYELLRGLQEGASGARARAVEEGLAAAEDVLAKLGMTPTPRPEATPSPGATATPTAAASPEPSAAPGDEVTPNPSPYPTATHPAP